ncbi:MAG: hypothetical protein KAS32_20015 [Candidatus Peribacteraceae bacterium]|nr:hypothetical protein [Candidatus Peribacteraceae bacterium]
MARLIPKKKKLRKKKLLRLPPKKELTSSIFPTFVHPDNGVCLDQNRLHFYAHSMTILGQLGGIKWIRVLNNSDLMIMNSENIRVIIPLIILCSRNRLYAFEYIKTRCCGKNTDKLQFEMDQYDIELAKILKESNNACDG